MPNPIIKSTLFKKERQQRIRSLIDRFNKITVAELVADFQVSAETIRRDLNSLEDKGFIERTHGGAISNQDPRKTMEASFLKRIHVNSEEKKKIAEFAAGLIKPGEVIYLSPGSTVYYLAEEIINFIELTVLTNSLIIANLLAKSKTCQVIVIGGILKKKEMSLINIFNENLLASKHIDKIFLGCRGIHPIHGITNDSRGEMGTDSRIADDNKKVIVLADSTKFGYQGKNIVAPIEYIEACITTKKASGAIIQALQEKGIEIHQV